MMSASFHALATATLLHFIDCAALHADTPATMSRYFRSRDFCFHVSLRCAILLFFFAFALLAAINISQLSLAS